MNDVIATAAPHVGRPEKAKRDPRPKQARIEVRVSRVHGRGVFATKPIRKGSRIIEYTGQCVSWLEASEQNDGPHTFLFGLTDGDQVIDPARGGNEARWINHSCAPNCEAVEDEEAKRVFIYALRNVRPGEELFYDYGLEVDEPRTPQLEKEYACSCASPNCRGTMLGP